MRKILFPLAFLAMLTLGVAPGCRQAAPPALTQVVAVPATSLPGDPLDPAWSAAPEYVAVLVPQDIVEPRQMRASTPEVRVRAMSDGKELAFRLAWMDHTPNDLPQVAGFCDACAIQVPAMPGPTVPAPQMGEAGKPVQISYWNAAWQAKVDGRGDTIRDLYPRAAIDHYPFQAPSLEKGSPAQREMAARYAPARALGNPAAGPRQSPVEDLLAEGPGSLAPAPAGFSRGRGRRTVDGWAVVITRSLPAGAANPPGGQVAFAVWDGSQEEVGSRKMRTAWIPLVVQGRQ
jgi:hypothetical protein